MPQALISLAGGENLKQAKARTVPLGRRALPVGEQGACIDLGDDVQPAEGCRDADDPPWVFGQRREQLEGSGPEHVRDHEGAIRQIGRAHV